MIVRSSEWDLVNFIGRTMRFGSVNVCGSVKKRGMFSTEL
jgi:hypothetical protein